MPLILARAKGLRTKQARSMPGRVTSSTNRSWPVSSRASSNPRNPTAHVSGRDRVRHGYGFNPSLLLRVSCQLGAPGAADVKKCGYRTSRSRVPIYESFISR